MAWKIISECSTLDNNWTRGCILGGKWVLVFQGLLLEIYRYFGITFNATTKAVQIAVPTGNDKDLGGGWGGVVGQ